MKDSASAPVDMTRAAGANLALKIDVALKMSRLMQISNIGYLDRSRVRRECAEVEMSEVQD